MSNFTPPTSAFGDIGGQPPLVVDNNFNQVALLLHGDGANGANNNTFIDSSTNNFTITRNGDTTQGSYGPYGVYWSNLFNGSTSYLSIASNSAFNVGTGDFTAEAWIYTTTIAAGQGVIFCRQEATTAAVFQFRRNAAAVELLLRATNGTGLVTVATGSILTTNTWYHVAAVRTGTTINIYVNGILSGTGTSSTNPNPTVARPFTIGVLDDTSLAGYFSGYISGAKFTNGICLYTANFTPQPPPYTADATTTLLTCQSNRFLDLSPNNFTITVGGSPQVSPFNPTPNPDVYTPNIRGAAGYFDGTGDYLNLTGANLSATDWTVECWVYFTSFTNTAPHVFQFGTSGTNRYGVWRNSSTSKISFFAINSGVTTTTDGTTTPVIGTWYHIAAVRSSGSTKLYVNGILEATNGGAIDSGTNWAIGFQQFGVAAGDYFIGYISNFRVVTSAVYTANFTPPTQPLTAVANTSLLLLFRNGQIIDSSGQTNITGVGTPSISTSIYKYGTGSIFIGNSVSSGSYLSILNNPLITNGDLTIEFWYYTTSLHDGTPYSNFSSTSAGHNLCYCDTAASILWYYNGNTFLRSTLGIIVINTWGHIALVKNGSTYTIFHNGLQVGQAANTGVTSFGTTSAGVRIGDALWTTGKNFVGYIDDFRVTNGLARYTSPFTPPASAYPDNGYLNVDPYYTQVPLLVHGGTVSGGTNNTFRDSSTNNYTVTRNGDATQGSFSPYSIWWSNYFDGTGDYLAIARNNALLPGASTDFTVEAWVYLTAAPGATGAQIAGLHEYGTSSDWILSITSGLQATIYLGSTSTDYLNLTTKLTTGAWYHIAASRTGTGANNLKVFVNGQGTSHTTNASLVGTGSNQLSIGADQNGDESNLTGYISNVRFVNGVGLYNANFTPPTSPLAAVRGTQLLTCASNRFRDSSANAFTVTRNGDVRVSPFTPLVYTTPYVNTIIGGSAFFDGSDWLTATAPNLSGTWTVECWWFPTSGVTTQQTIIHFNNGSNSGVHIWSNTSGQLVVDDGANAQSAFTATTFTASQWNHLAVVRNGTTTTGYINGVAAGSNTFTPQTTSAISVGRYNFSPFYYNTGYIADLRLVNSLALYTAAFTPPVNPLTAVAGTQLLLSFQGANVIDNTGSTDLTTASTAQTTTAISRVGAGSLQFNGSSDYLLVTSGRDASFGAGDFTVEAWVYLTSGTTANRAIIAGVGGTNGDWMLAKGGSTTNSLAWGRNHIAWDLESPTLTWGAQWYHVAVSRVGGVLRIFRDGQAVASASNSTAYNIANAYYAIGAQQATSGAFSPGTLWQGYIDDVRVTRGIGRYVYNFTPSTQPHPDIAGTPPSYGQPPVLDPLFSNVTLLLHGDGTNAAQNNTFTDGSTNNFTITRNGNTTQGSFSPFGNLWSNYFGGSGNYLSIPYNAAFLLGTGDFTFETWAWVPSGITFLDGEIPFLCVGRQQNDSPGGGYNITIFDVSAPYIRLERTVNTGGSATAYQFLIRRKVPRDTWFHIAVVRNSGTTYAFWNGTQIDSTTTFNGVDFNNPNSLPTFIASGAQSIGNNVWPFTGYLSNMRLTKSVVYIVDFTPSFTPLTAITNTVLLTCQSNRFADVSSNAFAITVTGSPSVQRFSPFEPALPYSTSLIGGAGYFDGTGDYLTMGTTSSFNFMHQSAALWTCEFWVNLTAATSQQYVFATCSGATNTVGVVVGFESGSMAAYVFRGITSTWVLNAVTTDTALARQNQWTHFAITFDEAAASSNCKIYVNGTLNQTFNKTGSAPSASAAQFAGHVAALGGGTSPLTGYISNLRITNSIVYTANFTPPTAPLAAITNTQLLLGFTGGAIFDNAMIAVPETLGSAQINTSIVKWGTGSISFNGTNSYMVVQTNPIYTLTGDFTIEAWIWTNSQALNYSSILGSGQSTFQSGCVFFMNYGASVPSPVANRRKMGFGTQTTNPIVLGTTDINTNTWYHVAVTRAGSSVRLFVNGILEATATNSETYALSASGLQIGRNGWDGANGYWNGYIDDLRITNGAARYIYNFTPPAAAFPNQ